MQKKPLLFALALAASLPFAAQAEGPIEHGTYVSAADSAMSRSERMAEVMVMASFGEIAIGEIYPMNDNLVGRRSLEEIRAEVRRLLASGKIPLGEVAGKGKS